MRPWEIVLRGGCYDGLVGAYEGELRPVLVAWVCNALCVGHMTFEVEHPAVVLATAVAYRQVEVDDDQRRAVYEPGALGPSEHEEAEERELVGAGGVA